MSSQTSEHHVCRFGLYEVDPEAGILKRHGVPLKLQEQPFRILVFLLERPGEILSREELRNRLWPEGTFVEFDGSLNTALMKLRAVLNDDPENPRFVETVPKKGYRFIAPVQVVRGTEESGTDQKEFTTTGRGEVSPAENGKSVVPEVVHQSSAVLPGIAKRLQASFAAVTLFLAGVAVAAAAVWRYWPPADPQIERVTQLTHTGRVAPNSHLVTDGARLYFVSREGGQWALMTTSINGGSVEKLPSPFENTVIFDVSPDRTQLLIGPYTYEGGESPVWIWPAHGGVPHRLGDVLASEAVWSPAGDVIAIIQNNRLLTVHRDGSAIEELQGFPSSPHSPVWSADGKKLRFTIADRDRGIDEMWEAGSDGKNLRRVLPGAAGDRHDSTGVWSTEERYFLFTGGSDARLSQIRNSVSNVWALRERAGLFSRSLHRASELSHGPISFRNLAATGDSDRFFALGTHPEYQLIRANPSSKDYDVILPDAGATDVDVTADGDWLVYSLRENGALWKSRRNGAERLELTAQAPGALAPQWSPDGKEVLFTAFFLDKRSQLYVVPAAGGTPRPVLPNTAEGWAQSGDWSPDGKQILFDYFEQDHSDLRILDRAAGKVQELPDSQGLEQARWSPDGKHIAAINSKTHQIVLYTLDKKKWSVLAEAADAHGMRWSADSNFVYYQEMSDPEQAIYRVQMGHALPEKILRFNRVLGSMGSQAHFTGVAPDGSIYATLDRGGTDVYALDLKLP
jgi:Tol biopolymer transport system component/DNA-binding winged helix-turn-helix (wHTH) protein